MSTAYTPPPDARPTQTEHPWRATFRTALQVGIPAVLALGVAVPMIVQAILDEADRHGVTLPGWFTAALVGVAVVVTFIAGVVARIMAIPGVEEFLRRHKLVRGLAAAPPPPVNVPKEPTSSSIRGIMRHGRAHGDREGRHDA